MRVHNYVNTFTIIHLLHKHVTLFTFDFIHYRNCMLIIVHAINCQRILNQWHAITNAQIIKKLFFSFFWYLRLLIWKTIIVMMIAKIRNTFSVILLALVKKFIYFSHRNHIWTINWSYQPNVLFFQNCKYIVYILFRYKKYLIWTIY